MGDALKVLAEAGKIAGRKARHLDLSDLMELGFVAVVEAMHTYDPSRGGFRPYALPRVLNVIRNDIRRETRRYRIFSTAHHEEFYDHVFEERSDLQREIEALPERERVLIEMVDGAGYEGLEVGQLFGISKSRASSLRKEVHAVLRKRLE